MTIETNLSTDDLPPVEGSRAEPKSSSFDPADLLGKMIYGGDYMITLKAKTRKLPLFRAYLSKMVHDPEGLHLDELALLNELYYSLQGSEDPSFTSKYAEGLNSLQDFFKEFDGLREFPVRVADSVTVNQLKSTGMLMEPSAYFGLIGQKKLRNCWSLRLRSTVAFSDVKPKKVVGVGYDDKGNCQDPALDGNPSWQDVAQSIGVLEEPETWKRESGRVGNVTARAKRKQAGGGVVRKDTSSDQ